MKTIRLIRHAQSESNAGLVTDSPASTPITELGKWQSENVAKLFSEPPDKIYVSQYIRTQQTAAPLLAKFPKVSSNIAKIHEFTYLNIDRHRGTTHQERQFAVNEYWDRNDPEYLDHSSAETFIQFMVRIKDFIEEISIIPENNIAVFSHGYTIKSFWWLLINGYQEITPKVMRQIKCFCDSINFWNAAILELKILHDGIWVQGLKTTHLPQNMKTI